MSKRKPIYVTQPNLPPLDEFASYFQTIWDNKILTNSRPFHQQFEKDLPNYLGVKHISLVANVIETPVWLCESSLPWSSKEYQADRDAVQFVDSSQATAALSERGAPVKWKIQENLPGFHRQRSKTTCFSSFL